MIYDVSHHNVLVIVGFLLSLPYTIKYVLKGSFVELRGFLLIVFCASLMNLITTDNGIGGSILFIGSCGITAFCINNLKSIQYLLIIVIVYVLWFLYTQIFINGVQVEDILESVHLSKNYPGCLLVMLCCFWGFIKYIHYRKLPLVLPIASTIMAFFLDGRSSLICLVLLTAFCLVFRNKKTFFITLPLALVIISILLPSIEELYSLSSLSTHGMETSRYKIWESYFHNLDFPSLLFGLETHNLPYLKDYEGNPHNSLLNFHYRMGLIGVITILYYLLKSWKIYLKNRLYVLLFFSVVLWTRMFTDSCLVSAMDFIVFSMLFYSYQLIRDKRLQQEFHNITGTNNKKIYIKVVYGLLSVL